MHGLVQPGMGSVFLFNFYLGAVGTDNIGVIHLDFQIANNGIDIDPAELIPLSQFLGGECFTGFCLFCQLVDSGDDCVHVHVITSNIFMNRYGNTVFFGPAVDGYQFDLTQTPDGYFAAFRHCFVRLLAGKSVNGSFSGIDILGS